MITDIESPQNNDIQSKESITYQLEETQLNNIIANYYCSINTHQNNRIQKIAEQHTAIQHELLKMVQMRKQMEKVYQLQAMQDQHFTTIKQLVNENIQSQKIIENLQKTIKNLEQQNINNLTNKLQEYLISITPYKNFQVTNAIKICISEIGGLGLSHLSQSKEYDSHWTGSLVQLQMKQSEGQMDKLFQEQNEKYELFKRVYGCKFREVMLREQMVAEREQAFRDYSLSNHQLIDALLREKQRDKNLSKIQRQKLEEQFKARHQIELQTENMKHHQNNLLSYYELELEKLRNRNREIESGRQVELARLKKQIQTIRDSYEFKLKNSHSEINELKNKIEQLSGELSKGRLQGESKTISLLEENKTLTLKLSALTKQHKEIQEKMQSLQSHLNQTVLKLSQANRNKQELSSKLQEAGKKQGQLQQFITFLRSDLETSKRQKEEMSQQKQQLMTHSSILQDNYSLSKTEISFLQNKITALQNELTDSFIKNNGQFKKLNEQIEDRDQKIDKITKNNVQLLNQLKQKQLQLQNYQQKASQLQGLDLKQSIRAELERQSQRKQKLLDETILKISQLIC